MRRGVRPDTPGGRHQHQSHTTALMHLCRQWFAWHKGGRDGVPNISEYRRSNAQQEAEHVYMGAHCTRHTINGSTPAPLVD
jgi:hypothetical protein